MSALRLFLEYVLPDPEHSMPARAILVVGYAAATWAWWRAGLRTKVKGEPFWWRLGGALLFLLTLNKLFNLRPVFESAFRNLAKWGNWYDQRQPVQFVLAIVVPLLCAALTTILLATKGRIFFRRHWPALCGWVMLLLYLMLRQSQEWKPAVPWLLTIGYRDWRIVLESSGIVLVILSAL